MISAILFGWTQARGRINLIDREIASGPKRFRKMLLTRLARAGQKMTRRNITTQGGGTWAPLSDWTKAQTGRRKALVTIRKFVGIKRANANATKSATVFRSPGLWSLTQHHQGFVERPTGKVVKIDLKRPTALGSKLKSKVSVTFKDNREKVVPARPVWPRGRKLKLLVVREVRAWRTKFNRHIDRRRR